VGTWVLPRSLEPLTSRALWITSREAANLGIDLGQLDARPGETRLWVRTLCGWVSQISELGTSLLRRAPRAMDAVARTNDRQHFNQLYLVLVNSSGVLQGPPYRAVPHINGPVEHRTSPPWVPLINGDDWVDA
jgi:hypothetical protein